MRTCGNCGWIPPGMSVCYAWGEGRTAEKSDLWSACAHWKSKQDWREEHCGGCDFFVGTCRREPVGSIEKGPLAHACAEWMPEEGYEG